MKTLMRGIALSLLLSAIVVLSGFSLSTVSNNSKEMVSTSNADISLKRDLTIQVDELNLAAQGDKINSAKPGICLLSFAKSCATISNAYQNSTHIVLCTVKSVAFTVKNGFPYTKMDVSITDSLKGDLKVGDLITIVQMGGYMTLQDEVDAFHDEAHFPDVPADKRKDTIIEEKTTTEPYPKAGESYVLFFNSSTLFSGAYTSVNDYEGRYKLGDGGYYSRYVSDGEIQLQTNAVDKTQSANKFTYSQLKQQIKELSNK